MREENKEALMAAKRELEEEAGLEAKEWNLLGEFLMEGSVIARKKFLFLAKDLHTTKQALEVDEAIEIIWIPFQKALEMIKTGEISDGATVLALLLTQAKTEN